MVNVQLDYKPHSGGQILVHNSDARFRVLSCGRRWGKTMCAANECIVQATKGKEKVVWWVAPVYPQAMVAWRMLMKILRPTPLIKGKPHISENYIELVNGSTIWIKSADNPENLRSEGLDFVVLDEAALMDSKVWLEILRPALGDKKGKAMFASTPKGLSFFYELWLLGQDRKNNPEWESWQFPTISNPYFDPKEIEAIKKNTPQHIFEQEYEAKFLVNSGEVFRGIEDCFVPMSLSIPKEDEAYTMGADLARYNDFTVFTVINLQGEIVFFERFNNVSWEYQKARLIDIARKYNAKVIVDRTGVGQPIWEELANETDLNIFGYSISSNILKNQLIESLILSIENKKLHWQNKDELQYLTMELKFFRMERVKSGKLIYGAPSGYNDDCVISLALANFAMLEGLGSEWKVKDVGDLLNYHKEDYFGNTTKEL